MKQIWYITNGCGQLATIKFKKGDEYALRLSKLETGAEGIAKKALYAGAGVVADRIKNNLGSVPKIPAYQKNDLMNGFGITPMRNGGGMWDVHIGFDGYGSRPTANYPRGKPNQMIARAIESGTSFRPKTPFVRPAINSSRAAALAEMQRTIEEELNKIMK